MNNDAANSPSQSGQLRQHKHDLNVSGHSAPVPVPVFNCIVYVSRQADGVRARVANLAGFDVTAANEREALGQIVPAFKRMVAELYQHQTPIEWIDPPTPAEAGEQVRFIPVHL